MLKVGEALAISEVLNKSLKDEELLDVLESLIKVYKAKVTKKNYLGIPLSLFANSNLGILEVAVKYMKENSSMKFSELALKINRDQRTVWNTYNNAISKHKQIFKIKKEDVFVPCSIFSNRKLGPLEALVCYLKDALNMSFKQIAISLNRDYNTIWISYSKGKNHDK